jgi:hypothetical protein
MFLFEARLLQSGSVPIEQIPFQNSAEMGRQFDENVNGRQAAGMAADAIRSMVTEGAAGAAGVMVPFGALNLFERRALINFRSQVLSLAQRAAADGNRALAASHWQNYELLTDVINGSRNVARDFLNNILHHGH